MLKFLVNHQFKRLTIDVRWRLCGGSWGLDPLGDLPTYSGEGGSRGESTPIPGGLSIINLKWLIEALGHLGILRPAVSMED